jgi:hypothetical protein
MATDKEIINSLKLDWQPTDFYNFEALNRVELATRIVRDRMIDFYKKVITLEAAKTNRTILSIEFADSLNRIERNIAKLVSGFPSAYSKNFDEMKTTWIYNDPFDFSDAIRLERNLYTMFNIIEGNVSSVPYTGTTITGERSVILYGV